MTSAPLTLLGGMSAKQFLSEYWQKKPLLIRQAFPDFECPVTPDELAGLAMEASVESRIIEEQSDPPWQLRQGPFEESDFQNLPETHWTLLIQQLDAWVPEIEALKRAFNFIPNWRIDDVMASYAPDQGSVGPHFDYYDVFLLQATGQRHWQTGQWCGPDSPRQPDTRLNILSNMDTEQDWTLEPGDMLYLPPRLAHHGVAIGDCVTLSIGFRAPNHAQIMGHFTDYLLAHEALETRFYSDPDPDVDGHPGEIHSSVLETIRSTLTRYLEDNDHLGHWFGEFVTETKNPAILAAPEYCIDRDAFEKLRAGNATIYANEGSRFAYQYRPNGVTLFVDGKHYPLQERHVKFVQSLCEMRPVSLEQLFPCETEPEISELVMDLLNRGSLYCLDV